MKGVVLIAPSADFGNVPGLYHALRTQVGRVMVVLRVRDKKQMWRLLPSDDVAFGYKHIPHRARQYIVVSGRGFNDVQGYLQQWARRRRIKVILTDTFYRYNYAQLNELLRRHTVYCMPELMQYYDGECRTFYPPFENGAPRIIKNDKLTIAHSPFSTAKVSMKGTQVIEQTVQELNQQISVQYDRISGVTWQECIQRKAQAHIFIDQIVDCNGYRGGLGKSGIEAMALGCMTLSSGDFTPKDSVPPPPVVEVTTDTLYNVLVHFVQHLVERSEIINEQQEWMRNYASYKFVGEHLLQ